MPVASVTFPFHAGLPVVELVLLAPDGKQVPRRLVIESGDRQFAGISQASLFQLWRRLAELAGS